MEPTLLENLKTMQLTEAESVAYLTLLEGSPMSGYAVAKKSGIPKNQIYEVLAGLIKKGAAAASRHTSSQYIAVPYSDFFSRYQMRQRASRRLAQQLCRDYLDSRDRDDEIIWSLYREQDIYAQLSALIDSAQSSILMKLWSGDMARIEKSLEGAFRRGVKLSILVLGDYRNRVFPTYVYPSLQYRPETDGYRSIKAEFDAETICCCSMTDQGQSYAAWTTNPILLRPVHASLISDLSIYQLYAKASPERQALWGEDLINLRKKYR